MSPRVAAAVDAAGAVTAAVALAGAATLWVATRAGIGVSADSTVYLAAARSLLEGRGLTAFTFSSADPRPLVHFPPLYPALLAIATAPFRDPLAGARALNALLFGANLLLAAALVRRMAPGSRWLAPLAAVLLLTSPDLLLVHSMAWSEPLFLVACLAALLLLDADRRTPRNSTRVGAAVAAALALLTRFVGIAVAVTGAGALLVPRGERVALRLRRAALFTAAALLPMALWLVRNAWVSGGSVDRSFTLHPAPGRMLHEAAATVSSWAVAGRVRESPLWMGAFAAELVLAAFVLAGAFRRRAAPDPARDGASTRALTATFVLVYLAVLVANACCFERDSQLDARALAPVHVTGLALLLGSMPALARGRAIRVALAALGLLVAGTHLARAPRWVAERGADGLIYSSRAWRESETMGRVRLLAAGAPIYSNAPEAIQFLADRPAAMLPEKVVHGTGRPNPGYEADLEAMRRRLAAGDGTIVLFDAIGRDYLPRAEELRARFPLRPLARARDGTLYCLER